MRARVVVPAAALALVASAGGCKKIDLQPYADRVDKAAAAAEAAANKAAAAAQSAQASASRAEAAAAKVESQFSSSVHKK